MGVRIIWVIVGFVSVGIGSVAIAIPGLPTTVFFVFAAWCFARSNPRLEAWLLSLPGIGSLVSDYRAGLGMPQQAKIGAVASITVACGISAVVVDKTWVAVAIVASGLFGIYWVLARVPTRAATTHRARTAIDVDTERT